MGTPMREEVVLADGRVIRASVRGRGVPGPDIVEDVWGERQTGKIAYRNRGLLVLRQRTLGGEWALWRVVGDGWERPRPKRWAFAPEAIEEATKIARPYVEVGGDMSDHQLARILDGKTFGWEDAKLWLYLTDVRPEIVSPFDERGPGRWMAAGGIDGAVALARIAYRRARRERAR